MVLLAALQTLLHRYSGQDDIVVGSPIANRNRSEVEGLIGYFVNMLALRTDLSGDPSFLDLVRRVREVALSAYEHQDLPLEKVIEALRPPRDPSRTPLFQVMFVLQNNQVPDLAHDELTLDALDLDEGTGTAKFDLTLAIAEADRGARRRDRVQHRPVRSGDDRPDERALPGPARRHPRRSGSPPLFVATDGSRGAATGPRRSGSGPRIDRRETRGIPRLFEAQAERTPDALAVECEGRPLTYRRAQRACESVGPRAEGAGSRSGYPRRDRHDAVARPGRRAARGSSRPAGRSSRSTPITPRIGSRPCSRIRGRACS